MSIKKWFKDAFDFSESVVYGRGSRVERLIIIRLTSAGKYGKM